MARILGRDRMRKVLKALPNTVRARIRQAIIEASEDVADSARTLVPYRTGALYESIKVTPGDQNVPAYASLKSKRTVPDPELAAIISAGNTNVRYAHLVEFGAAPHVNKGQFAGTQNPGARPRPFFFPAFRANKRKAQAKINKAARQGIKDGLK